MKRTWARVQDTTEYTDFYNIVARGCNTNEIASIWWCDNVTEAFEMFKYYIGSFSEMNNVNYLITLDKNGETMKAVTITNLNKLYLNA